MAVDYYKHPKDSHPYIPSQEEEGMDAASPEVFMNRTDHVGTTA